MHSTFNLCFVYYLAEEVVKDSGYLTEINWQQARNFESMTEQEFLTEYAWVVLSSGMRETVVRKHFPAVATAFNEWTDVRYICENTEHCKREALSVFNNERKIESIVFACQMLSGSNFNKIKREIQTYGVDFLPIFPHIGEITKMHFAKNIGIDCAKPDRHLLRISELLGYQNPVEMCQLLSQEIGIKASVIDIVLWRFATLVPGYTEFLNSCLNENSLLPTCQCTLTEHKNPTKKSYRPLNHLDRVA